MSKEDFTVGQSKVEDFWKFINERHSIYLKRKEGFPRPWTDDPIFLDWKFTNVFRELDRGTIAIRQVLHKLYVQHKEYLSSEQYEHFISNPKTRVGYKEEVDKEYIRNQFITCILYRMFGHYENCIFGPITSPPAFYYFLRGRRETGKQIFTGAYMQPSIKGENKLYSFERVCRQIVLDVNDIILEIGRENLLQYAWEIFQDYNLIGPFLAYEFVCDLRYTDILRNATDTCTWCNIGPGAGRGLKRMGLNPSLESIQQLFNKSFDTLRYCEGQDTNHPENHWINKHYNLCSLVIKPLYPYWELREIEHCLCEFDKYERIRLGQGRPRAHYNGRS